MKTATDNQWLEQFQLVKVTRRIENDIRDHRKKMASLSGHDTDWDSALVDWTIHSTPAYCDLTHEAPQI